MTLFYSGCYERDYHYETNRLGRCESQVHWRAQQLLDCDHSEDEVATNDHAEDETERLVDQLMIDRSFRKDRHLIAKQARI